MDTNTSHNNQFSTEELHVWQQHQQTILNQWQNQLIDLAYDAILVRDPESHILYWNQGAEKLYGWKMYEVVGKVTHTLLQTRFPQSVEAINHQLEQYGSWEGDLRHICRDGSYVIVNSHQVLMRDEQGKALAILEINHDITERRLLEHRLQASEQRARARAEELEAIFDALVDSIFVYNSEGQLTQMNATAEAFLTQHLPTDYITRPPKERFAILPAFTLQGEPITAEQWPVSRMLAGETIRPQEAVEIAWKAPNNKIIYASLTGGPIRAADGTITGAVSITRDITEQYRLQQLEQAMRNEMEARLSLLQLVLDELPSSVYLVRGNQARLVLANHATTTIWGAQWQHDQPMEDFLKQHSIQLFGEDGQLLSSDHYATLRATRLGESTYAHREIVLQPDGTKLPVLVNAVPLDTLSTLHRLPQELAALASTERVALVVHQDVTAIKEAEELKDNFIHLVTHELRTPVTVLALYVERWISRTRQHKGAALDEWQQRALQDMKLSMRQLEQLTEDLLDVTRLQARQFHLQLSDFDLVALVRKVVAQQQLTTSIHQLSVQTSLPHVSVMADIFRIEQVLTNLLNNAIKFSPNASSIVVTIERVKEGQEVCVSVRDQGLGIPRELQGNIFERFTRGSNVQEMHIQGTGLGLYLCRELVERHGGSIWFESEEKVGTTFFFTLPCLPDA